MFNTVEYALLLTDGSTLQTLHGHGIALSELRLHVTIQPWQSHGVTQVTDRLGPTDTATIAQADRASPGL